MKRFIITGSLILVLAGVLYVTGHLPFAESLHGAQTNNTDKLSTGGAPPPAVTVVLPKSQPLKQTVLVTGTLVARRQILIAPEIEGLRIVEIFAEEGDQVEKGQRLARLDKEVLITKLAENAAAIASADATIAQAESNIDQAEARNEETSRALKRARPLVKSRTISASVFEQRQAVARTAKAQLVATRDGLNLAKAAKNQVEAKRNEIRWRMSKTIILAPTAGVISRRNARIGAVASGGLTSQPMFHLVKDGAIELKAEVPEAQLGKIRIGQPGQIVVPGGAKFIGKVRLVSPEIDSTTRLGNIRVSLPRNDALRIGGFARGHITTAVSEGLTVPLTAVNFTEAENSLKVVVKNRVETRVVETGIQAAGLIEIKSGLKADEEVIAKAGSFLRNGDAVAPARLSGTRLTEVH